ncbi:MAG: glycoside hydrolase family 31 protein, partial [Candidatus Thermoplasmatota archaeon]|nr:glycoside hydrolase family 31 protein [Candidatus Thermoplasmatota archaeon]
MKISRTLWNGIHKVSINDYIPVVDYKFSGKSPDNSQEFYMVEEIGESLRITMSLAVREHVLGLGERAYDIDRRMGKFKSWNSDAFAYEYRKDPL